MTSPKNEATIFARWPERFASRGDVSRSLMVFGFGCEDGWFPLISDLLEDLEPLAAPLDTREQPIEILQVKQKFGELRVAASRTNDAMEIVILAGQERRLQICEKCGGPGSLNRDVRGRRRTLFDQCRNSDLHPPLLAGL
jgi:hypothetical protein